MAAFWLNQLLVLALPFLACELARRAAREFTGKTFPTVSIRPYWSWLMLGMTAAFTVLRNLPRELFDRI